tara:strand:+ start:1385 stop:1543 length:159 start_codon:yes stop_codon:yes gene_type:complete
VSFGSWQYIAESNRNDETFLGKDYPCLDTALAAARNATGRPYLSITETQEIY